ETHEAALADEVFEVRHRLHDPRGVGVVLTVYAAREALLGLCHRLVVARHEHGRDAVPIHGLHHARRVGTVVEDVEHAVVAEDVLALWVHARRRPTDVLRPDVDDAAHHAPRGRPSTRWEMMLRCTSEVPA